MTLEEALQSTGTAETGYTVVVREEDDHTYTLSFANGAMPPYLFINCDDLDEVRHEISTSYLGDPDQHNWTVVPDEDEEDEEDE